MARKRQSVRATWKVLGQGAGSAFPVEPLPSDAFFPVGLAATGDAGVLT